MPNAARLCTVSDCYNMTWRNIEQAQPKREPLEEHGQEWPEEREIEQQGGVEQETNGGP